MLILVEDATEPVAPEDVETGVKIRLEIGSRRGSGSGGWRAR
jgi:hypothetical protein